MSKRSRMITACISSIGIAALIFDSKTAILGAAEGIDLCLRTVVPSLLPFFVLSILLTNAVSGTIIPFLSPVGRLCGIPRGAESLLLIGLLGGYPVGAQAITEAYHGGSLTKQDAHRLLGFCSNAGPAFIFGIAGSLFRFQKSVFFLWGIHILSALMVGMILPDKAKGKTRVRASTQISFPAALAKAIRILSGVCGWIILFRIFIAFLDRWVLWILPETARLLLIGSLELANGCNSLLQAQSEPLRFMLAAVILGFGGICVGMQTISVTGELGTGFYFPGKLLQGLISLVLSAFAAQLQYRFMKSGFLLILLAGAAGIVFLLILVICKKTVAFSRKEVYNS